MRKLSQKELDAIEQKGGKVTSQPVKPVFPFKPKPEKAAEPNKDLMMVAGHIGESVKATQIAAEAMQSLSASTTDQTARLVEIIELAINTSRNSQGGNPVRLQVNRSKGLIDSIDVIPLIVKQ